MSHRSPHRDALRERAQVRREQASAHRRGRRERWDEHETRRRARRVLDRAADNRVTGAVLITVGANWLLMELGLFPFGFAGLLSLSLAVMGLALMATAKAGSAAKFVVLGCLMTGALVMSSGVTSPIQGKFAGDSINRPLALADVKNEYSMGFGDLVIDLTSVDFEQEVTDIRASLIAGDITVILPADAAVEIDARIDGAGEIRLLDRDEEHGAGHVRDEFRDRNWGSASERLRLDLDLDFGEITVKRAS